jgi:hypothetical protein
MKTLLSLSMILLSLSLFCQNEYIIEINDTTFEISLDNDYSISSGGNNYQFKIKKKDTLLYNDDAFSFNYSKDYKVSKLPVDKGIEQIMLMTAEGSGILIQKYSTINPSMLNEMMMEEVTKESVSYGYVMKRKDYKRRLKSGQKINVDKAILTYNGERSIYEIASIGAKDEGIMVMTIAASEEMSIQGRKIIDLMWSSLVYKK